MTEEQAKPLDAEGESSNDYIILESPKKPTWRCPKCGRTDLNGWTWDVKGEVVGELGLAGTYCGICLMEWAVQYVPKMVEVGR